MGVDFAGMFNRMVRAAMLDAQVFEEVEHDPSKDQEALMAVLVVALINGVLSLPMNLMFGKGIVGSALILVFTLVWTVIGYYIYAFLTFYIGTNFFGGTADFGELRRVLGYAYAPNVFSWIPCVGPLVAAVWSFVVGIIAVRQALDVDTTKAVFTVLVAIAVVFIASTILVSVLGLGAMGMDALR